MMRKDFDCKEKLVDLYIAASELMWKASSHCDTVDLHMALSEFDEGVYDVDVFRQAIDEYVYNKDTTSEQIEMEL